MISIRIDDELQMVNRWGQKDTCHSEIEPTDPSEYTKTQSARQHYSDSA